MCEQCEKRRKLMREAFLQGKIAEAVEHAAKGVAQMVGQVSRRRPVNAQNGHNAQERKL